MGIEMRVAVAAVMCCGLAAAAGPYTPTWPSVTKHPTPAWFGKAKFGIYAHWGPYSVPAFGNEWYSRNMYINGSSCNTDKDTRFGKAFGYKDFVPMFTADKFNATAWAELYARAGARYAGPVAEHADGFCMWDSKISHYNAAEMGPKRDVVGEIVAAVRALGLHTVTTLHHQWLYAWYPTWSNVTDCYNPAYELTAEHGGLYGPRVSGADQFPHPNASKLFQDYFLAKAVELVDGYQPDLVYYDSKLAAVIDEQHRLDFLAHYYNQAATLGKGVVCTYKNTDLEPGAGTIDYERGGVTAINPVPWQTDDAMDRHSWSWVNPPSLKNSTELIGELVDIVSKNGNLLLDIPPHADGSIDAGVVATLHEMGDFLRVNGPGIFNSRPWTAFGEGPTKITPGSFHEWPIFTARDFRFTVVGNVVFAFAMAWSDTGYTIHSLNSSAPLGVGSKITAVSLLGSAQKLAWQQGATGLVIQAFPKPADLHVVLGFQVTLDSARVGFLTWDVLRPVAPGATAILAWASLHDADQTVDLAYAAGRGASGAVVWEPIASVPNVGRFEWEVPAALGVGARETRLLLRIQHAGEQLEDLAEVVVAAA